jgi:1,4-dihydroxy-2-naphthoyl-CoA hydrolase
MKIWKREMDLERASERCKNTMVDHLGIEFTVMGDDFLTASMPIDHRTKQPVGIMHGGASCALAETVGSTAANFCVDEGYYCVGLDINVNHLRAMRSGFVFATARPYHLGRSTQVWGIEIKDENKNLISVSRLTMAVLKA